uniref:sulfotransferase family protein n=1 Tax=Gelidibacter sp. TaxID=2018083 RepID=UPI0040499425
MESPIFIFSLPRSGSTLLQRVLMTHDEICSLAEPWILLPHVYILKEEGTLAEYSSQTAFDGTSDFINNLPNNRADYINSLRKFMLELYEKQCKKGERFYLDKTPRYYYIIDEIVELFPDAKFIFLFRNPIHVYASIVNTWGGKRFKKLYSTYDDMIFGTKELSKGYTKYKSKSIAINYERFVTNTQEELENIATYLNIDINLSIVNEFSKQDTKGALGDPTGVKTYSKISSEGLDKWKETFNSFIRKKYAISLLNKIDKNDLLIQGYNKQEIIDDVKRLNNKKNKLFFMDVFDYFVSYLVRKTNLNIFVSKKFSWVRKKSFS